MTRRSDQAQLEREIADARAQLANALSDIQGQIGLLEEQAAAKVQTSLREALETAQTKLAEIEALAHTQADAQTTLQAAEVEQSRLTERNRQLKEQMNETKARLDALAEADARCPLCRQPLTPEHQAQTLPVL